MRGASDLLRGTEVPAEIMLTTTACCTIFRFETVIRQNRLELLHVTAYTYSTFESTDPGLYHNCKEFAMNWYYSNSLVICKSHKNNTK